MLIHMIRHGDTEATEKKLYYGTTDLPLSPKGREKLAAKREQGGYPRLDGLKVYTSGMLRTEETLSVIYGDVPHEALPEFREMAFGEFEMRSYEELRHVPAYIDWITGDMNKNLIPGGESGEMFEKRVIAQLKALIEKGEDCLLIVHGGVIAKVMDMLFPEDTKNFYEWQPKPGEGYTVEIGEGKASSTLLPAPYWKDKGYAFFRNTACEYFPCHKTARPEDFNCLFCYCPLYALGEECGGNFRYTDKGVKDCGSCLVPHRRENYGRILEKYPKICELAKKKNTDI